jgi:hypothetical protein
VRVGVISIESDGFGIVGTLGVLSSAFGILCASVGNDFEVLDLESDCGVSLALGFSVGLDRTALKTSTGKSAKPIARLLMVPISAEAPPEIGSHGPSSESYSTGRYLIKTSVNHCSLKETKLTVSSQQNLIALRCLVWLQQKG